MNKILITVLIVLIGVSLSATAGECVDRVIPSTISATGNTEVEKYVEALKGTVLFSDVETKGSYCHLKSWYEERTPSRQFSSRMLAVLIIVLGASLPLVGILEKIFTNQKFWIAFIGAAIVVAQGFAQTFQYEESWRIYTVAKLELEEAHRDWQKDILNASLHNDGLEAAQKATDVFSRKVSKIVLKETTGFFDLVTDSMKNLTSKSSGTQ